MSAGNQISTMINPEIKVILQRMAKRDLRTLKGQLEWLILQEEQRRAHLGSELRAPYSLDAPQGICPSCGQQARFLYAGTQEDPDGQPFGLYTCSHCHSTISGRHIQPAERAAELMP